MHSRRMNMSELAILGGPRTRTEPYPQWPVWDQRDIDIVTEVIQSGRWGGYPYPGPKTAELAENYGLIVIEDCAHAHGAQWNGRGAGTIGHFGSFSLQSSKTLTTGEGGILLCRTPELAAKAASIIDCGRPHALGGGPEDGTMDHQVGGNFRLSELAAALALVGIERFPAQ